MLTKKLITTLPKQVLDELPSVIDTFKINNPLVLSHFLAQCAHESGNFKFVRENLNYSAQGLLKTFPRYFSKDTAEIAARKPELIADLVYSSRMGNGPKGSGDAFRFRGRGYIQLTGRYMYKQFGDYIEVDLLTNPDLVATKYPLLSAAWFFEVKVLWNLAARDGSDETVKHLTRRINGAYNGLADRISKTKLFTSILC
jgi:putative chitinase